MLTTRKIAGIGILGAIVIVLQLISNYISFGSVSITLSLIPITIGAIIYGPLAGLILGMINGGIVLTAPSTAIFLEHNAIAAVFLCLSKTGLAGLIVGFIPKIFKKHEKTSVIVSSLLVPIINTGIFIIFCLIWFMDIFPNPTPTYLIITVIGINFLIEFAVSAILSPVIYYIINIVKTKIMKKETN